jgi:lysophospholipase
MSLRRWQTGDAKNGTWIAPDGWLIRTAHWQPKTSRGTIFFLNGRGDFIEKYAESCRQWAGEGYDVLTWDWRGQGLSGRMFGEKSRTHLERFEPLLEDALAIVRGSSAAALPKPWFVCAHSMGAHLALRMLHDAPGIFSKAVLCAPMLGINAGPLPPRLARRFIRLAIVAGLGKRFAVGQTPYGAATRSSFRQTRLTSDVVRFQEEAEAIDANSDLAVGGVTFGWVEAAFRSLDVLEAPGYLEAIETPVLVLLAGREQVVDSQAAENLSKRLPKGRVSWIEGAAHELLRERDDVRAVAFEQIAAFLGAEIGANFTR